MSFDFACALMYFWFTPTNHYSFLLVVWKSSHAIQQESFLFYFLFCFCKIHGIRLVAFFFFFKFLVKRRKLDITCMKYVLALIQAIDMNKIWLSFVLKKMKAYIFKLNVNSVVGDSLQTWSVVLLLRVWLNIIPLHNMLNPWM